MRTINFDDVGNELKKLISGEDPISEDIGILDSNGDVIAVVIPNYLYNFLQQKVEEAEDAIDDEAVKDFHNNRE